MSKIEKILENALVPSVASVVVGGGMGFTGYNLGNPTMQNTGWAFYTIGALGCTAIPIILGKIRRKKITTQSERPSPKYAIGQFVEISYESLGLQKVPSLEDAVIKDPNLLPERRAIFLGDIVNMFYDAKTNSYRLLLENSQGGRLLVDESYVQPHLGKRIINGKEITNTTIEQVLGENKPTD